MIARGIALLLLLGCSACGHTELRAPCDPAKAHLMSWGSPCGAEMPIGLPGEGDGK